MVTLEKFSKWNSKRYFPHESNDGVKRLPKHDSYKNYYLNECLDRAIRNLAVDFVSLFAKHGYDPLSTKRYIALGKVGHEDKYITRFVAAKALGLPSDDIPSTEEIGKLCKIMAIILDLLPNQDAYQKILASSTRLKILMHGVKFDCSDQKTYGIPTTNLADLKVLKEVVKRKIAMLQKPTAENEREHVMAFDAAGYSNYPGISVRHDNMNGYSPAIQATIIK